MRLLLLILLVWGTSAEALTYTKSFSEKELQTRLLKMMPIEKSKFMGSVKLHNPVLDLRTSNNRLTLTIDIAVTAIGGIKGNGQATVNSGIRYAKKEGAFYLDEPKLVAFEINEVPSKLHARVEDTVQALLAKALEKRPVYRLDDKDIKQKLVKSTLKEIRIEDQYLFVDFSLF
mgnify:FL=1